MADVLCSVAALGCRAYGVVDWASYPVEVQYLLGGPIRFHMIRALLGLAGLVVATTQSFAQVPDVDQCTGTSLSRSGYSLQSTAGASVGYALRYVDG
jgi:hypothetical protein